MISEKKRRLSNAVGFLSGVIASMDAIRDQKVSWPPAALWGGLRDVQRVELGAGVALIVLNLVIMVAHKRTA